MSNGRARQRSLRRVAEQGIGAVHFIGQCRRLPTGSTGNPGKLAAADTRRYFHQQSTSIELSRAMGLSD